MARELEFNLDYRPERRGFGKKKGVPDEVVWIEARTGGFRYRFPLLIELEGNLPNAVRDFSEFSRRALPNRDFVRIRVIGRSQESIALPRLVKMRFAIAETSYESSDLSSQGDEGDLFHSIREWCGMQQQRRVLPLRSSRDTQQWTLQWFGMGISIFGLRLKTRIPVMRLRESTAWTKSFLQCLRSIEIPCVVVSRSCSWGKRSSNWSMPVLLQAKSVNP